MDVHGSLLQRIAGQPRFSYIGDGPMASEPTALAAMSLLSGGLSQEAETALFWLASLQSEDGSVGVTADQPTPGWATSRILSTASGSRLRCNPDRLCERGHFKGAAEAVAEIGEGAYAQLLRCLHQRCEDVHRTGASLATAV